jgi:hypothetical protein
MKIAPGVRVRASSRGFSAGVGPRVARVHVGTRGVGVSSGIGPFGAYTHLGGGGQRRSTGGGQRSGSAGPSRATLAALERATRQAEKAKELQRVTHIERDLVSVHLERFPVAGRAVLPAPRDPDGDTIGSELLAKSGVVELEARLGGGIEAPVAPAPEAVDADAIRSVERGAALEAFRFSNGLSAEPPASEPT